MSSGNELKIILREWTKVFMNRSMSDFKRFMEDTGLSFSQINILMHIFHGGMSGVSEVGERMGITNPAASQTVDRLVQMDLIKRSEDPNDRRAKQLELTQKGKEMIESGVDARSCWIESLTESLSNKDQELITSAQTILTDAARRTGD